MVYHYTSINALVNILRKDEIVLRATNILYFNDPHEVIEGITVINGVGKFAVQSEEFGKWYVTSFTSEKDNLNMWNSYAESGTGCALAFEQKDLKCIYRIVLKCIYGKENIEQDFNNALKIVRTAKVELTPNPDHPEITDDVVRTALSNSNILTTCLAAKNKAYLYERETRGAISCIDHSKIQFRTRNGYLIPYIDVSLPKSALKGIVIGPTDNSQFKKDSIVNFLETRGYDLNSLQIENSNIPYRV